MQSRDSRGLKKTSVVTVWAKCKAGGAVDLISAVSVAEGGREYEWRWRKWSQLLKLISSVPLQNCCSHSVQSPRSSN